MGIIVAAPTGRLTRALSSRALVFIGLISYPLYLWHWPILSFIRIVEGPAVPAMSVAMALLLSFVLATATFLWIERPLRSRRGRLGIISLTGAMAIVGLAGLIGANQWLKPRLYGRGLDAFSEAAMDWQYRSPGFIRRRKADRIDVWTAGPGPRRILIWGDSNAEQYGPRVQRLLDDGSLAASQTQVLFATRGSCPPIPRARIEEDEAATRSRTRPSRLPIPRRSRPSSSSRSGPAISVHPRCGSNVRTEANCAALPRRRRHSRGWLTSFARCERQGSVSCSY